MVLEAIMEPLDSLGRQHIDDLPARLRVRLAAPLPGAHAQRAMAAEGRVIDLAAACSYRRAAVLVALFPTRADGSARARGDVSAPRSATTTAAPAPLPPPEPAGWRFPLMVRTAGGVHSRQVALPGGVREPGESPETTALREAAEEVGLDPAAVELLGRLTPLPIPASATLVTPVVGALRAEPAWRPQPREVAEIFTVPLAALHDPALRRRERRVLDGGEALVPYYTLCGHKVWGATAMMLAELAALFKPRTAEP